MLMAVPVFLSCQKDTHTIIPTIRFRLTINMNDPAYSGKEVIEPIYRSGNQRIDLIVARDFAGNGYFAFDKLCPQDQNRGIKVKRLDGFRFQCPECKTIYHTQTEYTIVEGVSKWPLQPYATHYDQAYNVLSIWN